MRRKAKLSTIVATALIAATLGVAVTAAQAGGKGITALATGSGQAEVGSGWRTFSFTALTDGSGQTRGQGQLNNRDQGVRTHLDIHCLSVVGNRATVSGNIADSTNAANVGASFIFQVLDNGEGAAAPDQISLVFYAPGNPTFYDHCELYGPFTNIPVEAGNVQVH